MMDMPIMRLNHHSASILPFFADDKGKLFFLLEQKDPSFNPPYFNNGLSFIGGNYQPGDFPDLSPVDTLKREVLEEYWIATEADESLQNLLGETFTIKKPNVEASYKEDQLDKIRQGARILLQSVMYAADFVMRISPPITNEDLFYGLTTFTRKFDSESFNYWRNLLEEFDGKLTTDNLRWNSRIVFKSIDEIVNDDEIKFAYGYDHVLDALLQEGFIERDTARKLRTLRHAEFIHLKRMKFTNKMTKDERDVDVEAPTYEDLAKQGFRYNHK